jgi:hypothetical protein
VSETRRRFGPPADGMRSNATLREDLAALTDEDEIEATYAELERRMQVGQPKHRSSRAAVPAELGGARRFSPGRTRSERAPLSPLTV